MESTEETKRRILEAAKKRFTTYGFNKTTIAEIAADTSMSTGNIYRFFSCKHDIMAEMADGYFRECEASQREILKLPNITASERLMAFVLQNLKNTYKLAVETPKTNEIIEFVHENRKEQIDRHCDVQKSILAEILAEGNSRGEFEVPEILLTADVILHATILFDYPTLVKKFADGGASFDDLENLAKGVSSLIVNGIKKR